MFGGFKKKLAVNGRRETGDDNGCHILQRELALGSIRCFARQLAVATTQGAVCCIDADDVVGHILLSAFDKDFLNRGRPLDIRCPRYADDVAMPVREVLRMFKSAS